jgi:ribosomal protein S18 acetylase RimI-like enzyme
VGKISENVTVRSGSTGDARAISELHIAAWRAAYRGLMPDAYLAALDVEQRVKLWARTLSRPGPSSVAVAEIDGAIAGFCFFGASRDAEPPGVAEIFAVNVHPDHWRHGAGGALCAHALRQAASRESTSMTLWVLKGNDRARAFYASLGYAPDGAERTDTKLIGSPLHEMRYRKAIA